MRRLIGTCLLAMVVPGAPVRAQELTIEQLVATALERAPSLLVARTESAAAAARVAQVEVKPAPRLFAGRDQGAGGMANTDVGLEWPLDLRRNSRIEVVRRDADVVALSVRDRERRLASAVREQAGVLLAARRTAEVIDEALVVVRRLRDLADRGVLEGRTPRVDANLAAIEVLRLEADAALAAADIAAVTIELKALVGLTPEASLVVRDSLDSMAEAPFMPRLTPAAAIDARADIREAIARMTASRARLEDAALQQRPDVSVVAGYRRTAWGFPQFGFDVQGTPAAIHDIFHMVTIGAKVDLSPKGRVAAARAMAEAERLAADAEFTARQRAARAEIDTAVARDRETRRAVDIYAQTTRGLARQNVDIMLEAYELGRFTLSDLLGAQRRYLEIEMSYTTVLTRAYETRVAVARAFGEVP